MVILLAAIPQENNTNIDDGVLEFLFFRTSKAIINPLLTTVSLKNSLDRMSEQNLMEVIFHASDSIVYGSLVDFKCIAVLDHTSPG